MKLLRRAVVPLGLLSVVLIGCNTKTHEVAPARSTTFARLSEGDYLSSAYIDALKGTRSAFKAGKTGQMNLIVGHREGIKFLLEPIFNFHESGPEFELHEGGSVASVDPVTEYTRNPHARVLNEYTLEFGFAEFKPVTYVFVNDARDYVSRAVLVGKYQDRRGRRYEFTADGWAVFPDRKFKFEIGRDHVFNDYDYFMENKKTWAFKRNGSLLQIFPTVLDGDSDKISSDVPYVSLREVR